MMDIYPEHRADGIGHVLLNSSPGGEFGCEMFSSSGECDNI